LIIPQNKQRSSALVQTNLSDTFSDIYPELHKCKVVV
jgi:hypothetical protein